MCLACMAGMLMICAISANAQWTTSGDQTYTQDFLGVGSGPFNDAKLHVFNALATSSFPGLSVPAIMINRNFLENPTGHPTIPNIVEIWQAEWSQSLSLQYVITHDVKVGIGLSSPAYKLDVNGDIHTSSNARIDLDAIIGNDANITNDANINHDAYVGNDANIDNDLTVSHNAGVNNNLTVRGNIFMPHTTDNTMRNINAGSTTGVIGLHSYSSNTDGTAIEMFAASHSTKPGIIEFTSNGAAGSTIGFNFLTYGTDASVESCESSPCTVSRLRIYKNGKVAIGSEDMPLTTPGDHDYKLYVEKGILTERVKVALTSTGEWSDFVFANDYKLKPLTEVKSYIDHNKHLPDVPSAEEVVKNGVDLAKMDAKLLQKIEELTLYVIEQQKEIESLKKELKK